MNRNARQPAAGKPRKRLTSEGFDDGVDQAGIFVKQHAEDQAHGHGGTHVGQKGYGFKEAFESKRLAVEQGSDHQGQAQHPDDAYHPVQGGIAQTVDELVILQHHRIVAPADPAGLLHAVPVGKAVVKSGDGGYELENQKLNKKRTDGKIGKAIALPEPLFHMAIPLRIPARPLCAARG